jgi:hypothetical protein
VGCRHRKFSGGGFWCRQPATHDLSPPLSLLSYGSLVLYGIEVTTLIANTLVEALPSLSRLFLGVTDSEMSSDDHLTNYLISQQDRKVESFRSRGSLWYKLPRLQKHSINKKYFEHLSVLERMDILRNVVVQPLLLGIVKYVGCFFMMTITNFYIILCPLF